MGDCRPQKEEHGVHGLPDHRPGGAVILRRPGQGIKGVDQFHDGADGGVKMETILDVPGDLPDGLMGLAPQVLQFPIENDLAGEVLDFP